VGYAASKNVLLSVYPTQLSLNNVHGFKLMRGKYDLHKFQGSSPQGKLNEIKNVDRCFYLLYSSYSLLVNMIYNQRSGVTLKLHIVFCYGRSNFHTKNWNLSHVPVSSVTQDVQTH
jgi:hypothetical protein